MVAPYATTLNIAAKHRTAHLIPVINPLELVGIFPNEGAILRLVGALLLEENDE